MSRFFAAGGSSDDDTDSDSDDMEATRTVSRKAQQKDDGAQRFQYESSSESEDEVRVIRSEKEKRYDGMQMTCKALRNHVKIGDWGAVGKSVDELQKQLSKAKNITSTEGIPRFYVKAMLNVEEQSNAITKAAAKKMSKAAAKNLNSIKAKFKKWRLDNVSIIEAYEANPLGKDEHEKVDTDSEDEFNERKEAPSDGEGDDEEEDEEEDWDSDVSSEEVWDEDTDDESDFEIDDEDNADEGKGPMYQRSYWTKKPEDALKAQAREEARQRAFKEKIARRLAAKKESDAAKEAAKLKKAQKSKTSQDFTPEAVLKKIKEIISLIGKRSTDRKQMIEDLELLSENATDPAALLKVRTTLVAAYFEVNLNKGAHMNVNHWRKCIKLLDLIVDGVSENKGIRLSEDEDVEENLDAAEDEEAVYKSMTKSIITGAAETKEKKEEETKAEEETETGEKIQYVMGNMFGFVQRLAHEYVRSLRNIDHHEQAYVERLRDEKGLIELIAKARTYYQSIGKVAFESQVVLELIQLKYYRHDPEWDVLTPHVADALREVKTKRRNDHKASASQSSFKGEAGLLVSSRNEVINLSLFLYKHGDTRIRTRALLMHVYQLALHSRFDEARDLILMSHVEDSINEADVKTRILFNRTMAQMGLCAFRTGKYRQALNCLQDLFQALRVKELLGQGISTMRFYERDPEQEKLEKHRQYPYHQHINQDLLESCYLIGAMFSEIPNLVETGSFHSKRVISHQFRRLYKNLVRQAFTAPPENSRDFIMFATKAAANGDWQKSHAYLMQLRMWNLIPNRDVVEAQMLTKLKQVALKCFLKVHGCNYISITSESLQTRFDMPQADVRRIVSGMIYERRLEAAWDQPSGCLMLYRGKVNKLEKSALVYADKAMVLTEQNERLMDPRHNLFQGNKRGGHRFGRGGRGGRRNNTDDRKDRSERSNYKGGFRS